MDYEEIVIPSTRSLKWTPTAIDCYKQHCICNGCIYNRYCVTMPKIQGKPPMKWIVLFTYRKEGKPEE